MSFCFTLRQRARSAIGRIAEFSIRGLRGFGLGESRSGRSVGRVPISGTFPPPIPAFVRFPCEDWEASVSSSETWLCGAVAEKEPLGAREHPIMTRNSTRLSLLVAATLFFWSTVPTPAPAQTVSFTSQGDSAVGPHPQWVAVGDFNRDGKQDLAVANAGSNTVSVLLGNGDGTFQAARTFPAGGSGPASVAVGDFNGDGRQDLAVTLYGDGSGNTLAVLLGNGDGTFGAPLIFGVGPGPVSSAVADFNGDGIQDLAVANWDRNVGHTVSVLLGNGDGTFQAAQNFLAGQGVASVAVGDLDGDGRPDLAAGNYGGDTVSVLMNNAGPPPGFTLTVIKAGTGSGTVTSTPSGT